MNVFGPDSENVSDVLYTLNCRLPREKKLPAQWGFFPFFSKKRPFFADFREFHCNQLELADVKGYDCFENDLNVFSQSLRMTSFGSFCTLIKDRVR